LFFIEDESYIEEYENKIKVLETEINNLNTQNKGLFTEISELEDKTDSLNTEIKVTEQKRIDIIKSYEYYLKDILELDDTELERWFSTRYSADSTDTTSSTISSN
jgi:predicted nuclease with TOPRIM domain